MDITTKEDAINKTFIGWADAENAIDGFVAWAWEDREDIPQALRRAMADIEFDRFEQISADVAYTVNQNDEYRGESFETAAREWLLHYADDIIEALGEAGGASDD